MPITGAIPLPNTGMDEFLKQLQLGQQNRFNQGNLDISRQTSSRENEMQPLRMDELRAKIEEQKIINQNKDAFLKSQIKSNLALSDQRRTGAGGLGTGGKEELFFQNLVDKDNPQFGGDPRKIYEAANAIREGRNTLTDGTPINPLSPASKASFDRIIKSGNTALGLNQQRFANTTENLIKGADENAEAAIKYADLLGKAEGVTEKISGILGGAQSEDYQKYINFTRVDVPMVAGELMRELGVNASDEQKRMYKEVVNPISWDTNPKLALARWNHFKEMVHNVGRKVSNSPSETHAELKNIVNVPTETPVSQAAPEPMNSQNVAAGDLPVAPEPNPHSQAYALAREMQLPKFSGTPEEGRKKFQDWFNRQPNITKHAVTLYLKNKGKK